MYTVIEKENYIYTYIYSEDLKKLWEGEVGVASNNHRRLWNSENLS